MRTPRHQHPRCFHVYYSIVIVVLLLMRKRNVIALCCNSQVKVQSSPVFQYTDYRQPNTNNSTSEDYDRRFRNVVRIEDYNIIGKNMS